MITKAFVRRMAAYNLWQNAGIYAAAGRLSDAEETRCLRRRVSGRAIPIWR